MKVKIYIKVSSELDVSDSTAIFANGVKTQRQKMLNKGKLLMPYQVKVGLDRDDFIRNLTTVIIAANLFKIPRIAKARWYGKKKTMINTKLNLPLWLYDHKN